MLLAALALAGLPVHALGAPYPAATLDRPPEVQSCRTRYVFSSADPIAVVAAFYRAQAAAARVPLLDDSGARFADYRTLVFVQQPRFMDVVLSRRDGRTTGRVAFHTTVPAGCS